MERLDVLYANRFSAKERRARERMWRVLCRHFFQRYVREGDTTLDLGCGFGEFSRHIRAGKKIAVDINPGVATFLPSDVEFHLGEAKRLDFIASGTIDVCFTSNFFEHLPSKQEVDAVLVEVTRSSCGLHEAGAIGSGVLAVGNLRPRGCGTLHQRPYCSAQIRRVHAIQASEPCPLASVLFELIQMRWSP